MSSLEPPDSFLVSAAEGWLELGNVAEACAELGQVAVGLRDHPDVLEVRWAVSASQSDWPAALEIARKLFDLAPERASAWLHHAYALRRAPGGSLQAAWQALLPARERFPDKPIIAYNLACYACQLGRLDEARKLFLHALQAGNREGIKQMALQDSDLEPLREEIRGL